MAKYNTPENRAKLYAVAEEYARRGRSGELIDGTMDDVIMDYINSDPEADEYIEVNEQGTNGGLKMDYNNMPNNGQTETIGFEPPPWEGNMSSVSSSTQYSQPSMNNTNCGYYTPFQNQYADPRLKEYTKGMKYYGLNPYNFFTAQDMKDYYDYLEQERKKQCDLQYLMLSLSMKCGSYTEKDVEFLETFKFKTADQIMEEYEEQQRKIIEEQQRQQSEFHSDSEYDANGYRIAKAIEFTIRNSNGEVVYTNRGKYHKDENGHSYEIRTIQEDREMEAKLRQNEIEEYNSQILQYNVAKALRESYANNRAKWEGWYAQGLSHAEMMDRYQCETVNYKQHEKAIYRALRTKSYSKERFSDILNKCCNTDIDYANSSNFFRLSYDFDRDLHYQSLISTPEEMVRDQRVTDRLKYEYEFKRKRFMDKINNDVGFNSKIDIHFNPKFPKPNIDQLTIEDYDKPENQVMYTQITDPSIATENIFIPQRHQPTPQELEEAGVHLDANGQIIPESRTIGHAVVDEFGNVLEQKEIEVDPNNMSLEQLEELF